jgi:hypothetical protein
MGKQMHRIYVLGPLTFLIVLGGLIFFPKPAEAASSYTYGEGTFDNDVAIQGPNADIDAPVSHFRIEASANVNVILDNACVDSTDGFAGLRARVDGQDKISFLSNGTTRSGQCSGSDLVFNNVSPGSILRVDKINGQGHQAFRVRAGGTAATNVIVTQVGDPDRGNPGAYDFNSYGVGVWMGGSTVFHVTVPCSYSGGSVYMKWKDADLGQKNQDAAFPVYARVTNADFGSDSGDFRVSSSGVQRNNVVGVRRFDNIIPSHIMPGDQVTIRWENGGSANAMQHILPWGYNPYQGSCLPQDNPQDGASCQGAPTGYTAYIGGAVGVHVNFTNTSSNTKWWIGGDPFRDYDGDGTIDYSNNPVNGNEPPGMPAGGRYIYHYPRSGNSLGYPAVVNDGTYSTKQHSGVLINDGTGAQISARLNSPSNTSRVNEGQTVGRDFTVYNPGNVIGNIDYYFSVKNDETGAFFGNSTNMCHVSVFWLGGSIDTFACNAMTITSPGSIGWHIHFTDSNGAQADSATYVGNRTFDTFNEFGFLRPHVSYHAQLMLDGVGEVDSADMDKCITATCQTSINADLEPGQSSNVDYGLYIKNDTSKNFGASEYSIQAIASGGLSGSGSSPIFLISGGPVAYNATFNMTANYTGSVRAHLLWLGNNIDGPPMNINCSTPYTPNTRPSVKATQGDISSGGGFRYLQASGTQQCTLTSRRYFAPITAGGDESVGGIRTFAATAPYVSSAQFAAYALGIIHSPGGPNNTARFGFFSDSVNRNVSKLSFANVGMTGGNLGGNLGGQFIDAHCAPDYFNETSNTLNPTFVTAGAGILNPDSLPLTPDGTGQFYYQNPAGTPVKIGGTLSNNPAYPRKRVTIFVNGDVLITNNITYGPWNFDLANKTNNSPYLTIIAKGNISVNFSVSRMDGVYIAQPLDDVGVTKGAFYSCSIAGAVPSSNQVKTNCRNSLSVNGSVIAQHVHLLRSQGTLQDGTGDAAENFNYAPSTVIGLPSFRPNCGSVVTYCIGSLNSLPPVF